MFKFRYIVGKSSRKYVLFTMYNKKVYRVKGIETIFGYASLYKSSCTVI